MVQVFEHEHYLRRVGPRMWLTADRKTRHVNSESHAAVGVGARGTHRLADDAHNTYFEVALQIY